MASTFLDEKISSFVEDKFPEFVQKDHPVFVQFLKEYYKFLEAAKLTLTKPQEVDQILLENKLTTNFLANEEDGTRFVYEDSPFGPFQKDEIVTGQTSGATATILAEDNNNNILYIEANRFFEIGEIIVGATSGGSATISKYQGNPVQNIQQLLQYADVDNTVSDFLDHFRNSFLTAVPNTLATGVSKRKLVKSVRDLYRAKGSQKGHATFFRLMFDETPELTYPTENILKVSGGDWSSDTILRIIATENDPNNLVGQTITQTVNVSLDIASASAAVESILQLQEGESTVYQLILNVDSIIGTFVAGAEITGIDNADPDISIAGTVQPILVSATVTTGASGYTTEDKVTIASATGQNAIVSIIDVGSGEVGQVIIDNPGSGYTVGDPLYFDSTNTEGAGANAIVSCIGGSIAPEAGDISAYGMNTFDHIVFEDATESIDAYTGNQIELETATFVDLGDQPSNGPHNTAHGYSGSQIDSEVGEVVNVTMFSRGSGYEKMPTITPATNRITYNQSALTTSGKFVAGETITNNASPPITAIISTAIPGRITITKSTGAFATDQIITGSNSKAKVTISGVTSLGANATFLGWSTSGLGAISGVEVTNFGTGFSNAPTATVPVKMLLTRNTNVSSPPDITLTTAFASGDTITGAESEAIGTVTAWDNERQTLTVKVTNGSFEKSEILTRGSATNYCILSEISQGVLSTTIGTIGTTAGTYNNDKGKLSESLMRVQDSYYYQDFSYVVKVGAAIKDWRAEIKKAVHPAGFAMFGEVSITNKVSALMTVPVTGITSYTPTLASLFEAVLTTVIGRRLGTNSDGTTLLGSTEIKGTTDHVAGTLKRGNHLGHEPQLFSTVETITRSGTTATVETTGPHGVTAGEQVEISGVTTTGYDGVYEVQTALDHQIILESGTDSGTNYLITEDGDWIVSEAYSDATDDTFTIIVSGSLTTPATVGTGKVKLVSPFDNSTRDVTLRPHTDVTVYPVYSGWWSSNQKYNHELFTVTGNTTSGSKTVTNITTTKINVGIPLGVIGTGIPIDARFDSITTEGTNNNGTITLTHAATSTIAGLTLTFTGVTQSNRYGLGPRQSNAIKYMWATPPTEYAGSSSTDTTENHQIILESGDGLVIQEIEVLDRVDFTVTAATGKFIIDGVDKPALNLDGHRLYRFDLSSGTTSTHPFKLSETSEGPGEYNEQSSTPLEFSIEMESGSLTEYSILESDLNRTILAEDGADLMVQIYDRVTTYGTQGSAGAYVEIFTENIGSNLYYYCGAHSGMGNSLTVPQERIGDFIINEAFQLGGAAAVENILLEDGGYILYETDTDPETQSVMVSEASTITYESITENTPNRMTDQMAYAYPNMIRRESPEAGTDNVDAGGAGVYDTTMNYTNIQIGDHESNVHNRISDFADVRIVDIIKSGREILEIGDDTSGSVVYNANRDSDSEYEFTIMEDGSYVQMESGSAGIPLTSRKIWNVPPPSYVRLSTS